MSTYHILVRVFKVQSLILYPSLETAVLILFVSVVCGFVSPISQLKVCVMQSAPNNCPVNVHGIQGIGTNSQPLCLLQTTFCLCRTLFSIF